MSPSSHLIMDLFCNNINSQIYMYMYIMYNVYEYHYIHVYVPVCVCMWMTIFGEYTEPSPL